MYSESLLVCCNDRCAKNVLCFSRADNVVKMILVHTDLRKRLETPVLCRPGQVGGDVTL